MAGGMKEFYKKPNPSRQQLAGSAIKNQTVINHGFLFSCLSGGAKCRNNILFDLILKWQYFWNEFSINGIKAVKFGTNSYNLATLVSL